MKWINKNTTPSMVITRVMKSDIVIGGIGHPYLILTEWSEAKLNALNIFILTEDDYPDSRYFTFKEVINETTNHIERTPIGKTAEALQVQTDLENLQALEATDKSMVRIAEDLLDLLVAKGIITESELPQDAQDRLGTRRQARATYKGL